MNILIIDDDATNVAFFAYLLKDLPGVVTIGYDSPKQALAWCAHNQPDLVLVDYLMAEMDGLRFIAAFRAMQGNTDVPIIMATADTDTEVRLTALEMSANDFLTKPINKVELRARVTNLLALRKSQLQLANRAEWLAEEVKNATREIVMREREVIYRLSRASEYRDPDTGAHIVRMAHYSMLIAKNLGLPKHEQELIFDAAPMHDVGKIGTPDHILQKPGILTEEERTIMRQHAAIGAEILGGSASPLLQAAAQIAATHHEKFDGSGYPRGLAGTDIPLYGRIVAVADVFDALNSTRPYKPAWDLDRSAQMLRDGSGTHFDPTCVAAFFQDWEAVLQIRAKYGEKP